MSIPLIDIADSVAAGRAVGDVAEQIDRACREVGFFAIVGHGLDPALRQAMLDQARRFFAQPDAFKRTVAVEQSTNNRGWGGIGGEQLQPDLPADLKETFDIGPELPLDTPDLSPLEGPNQWPDLPGFRDVLAAYQDAASAVARVLLRIVAAAQGLPAEFFDEYHVRADITTRLNHYLQVDQRTADEQLGCGAHSDYGCLTLLYSDGVPGLQLLRVDDTWVDVEVPADALVVNLGDLLARWTNDVYRSTRHRVIPPTDRDRYSVPVFFNPSYDAVVECLPSCVTAERPARYGPIRAGDYIQGRYRDTFAYLQAEPA